MCTMITHQAKIEGRGKSGKDWFEVREANVSYDHPYDLPLEHALNIDFVNEAAGPGARVAVELSVEAARQLVQTIEAVLAQAEQRGVLEDCRKRLLANHSNSGRVICLNYPLRLSLRISLPLTL